MYLAVFFFLGGGAGFPQDVHPSVSFRRLASSGAICWGAGLAGPRLVAMRAGERLIVAGANYELWRLSWQTYPLIRMK